MTMNSPAWSHAQHLLSSPLLHFCFGSCHATFAWYSCFSTSGMLAGWQVRILGTRAIFFQLGSVLGLGRQRDRTSVASSVQQPFKCQPQSTLMLGT